MAQSRPYPKFTAKRMGGPEVSCVLPVYNGARYIDEAVASILAQSFENFELIVVNDGSTDETLTLLKAFEARDRRVRIIDQPNGGICSALNSGLAAARGRYLARMDADDVSLPDRFALQADYLDRFPGVSVVGGQYIQIDENGHETERGVARRDYRRVTSLGSFPPKVAVCLHPLIMTRTGLLKKVGGYSYDYPHAEDYDIFMKLGGHGEIHNPDFKVLKYRIHGNNISVQHLEAQERNAIRAELDNVGLCRTRQNKRQLRISKRMISAYTATRIARRRIALNMHVEATQFIRIFGNTAAGMLTTNAHSAARISAIAAFNALRWARSGFK